MYLKCILSVAFLFALSFGGTFGPPQYFYTGTWSARYVGDPCGIGESEFPRANEHKNKFVWTLQARSNETGIGQFYHFINLEDTYATYSSFGNNSQRNNCDVVFWTGHGVGYNGYMSFIDCIDAWNFSYSGYTKWVFIEACNFMHYVKNPYSYLSMFNGAHAIFSFASNYKWFYRRIGNWWDCLWGNCYYIYSEDRWMFMWNNYFSGQEMWQAYAGGVIDNHSSGGYGVEVAAVMLYGTIYDDYGIPHTWYGGCETKTNSYSDPVYYGGNIDILMVSIVSGVPSY